MDLDWQAQRGHDVVGWKFEGATPRALRDAALRHLRLRWPWPMWGHTQTMHQARGLDNISDLLILETVNYTREQIQDALSEGMEQACRSLGLRRTPAHDRRLVRAILSMAAHWAYRLNVDLPSFMSLAAQRYEIERVHQTALGGPIVVTSREIAKA